MDELETIQNQGSVTIAPDRVADRVKGAGWEFFGEFLFGSLAECEFIWIAAMVAVAGFVLCAVWNLVIAPQGGR